MARRTGVSTMYLVSRRLCNLVAAFTPIIKRIYPSNTALHNALATAGAACNVLSQELYAQKDFGD